MGIGLIDIDTKGCMMLRAHQSLNNKELSLRNKTMVDFYISVIKRYRKELLKLSTLIVADAYFSTSTFVNGIKKEGFSLISRFRDNACLFYVYTGPRTGKRGRPKTKDGKIDMKNLDLTRMEKMEMKDIEGTAYTLIAYSKALKCKVRLVIWQMPNGKKKLFFSTDTSLSGEEVLLYYRTRFQIEFCFYDKNNIMRSEWKSIIEDQNFRRMLLRSTSHNDNYFFRPLSQSLRFLLFSQDLSASRLGVRSVYAFSNASRFALESARA